MKPVFRFLGGVLAGLLVTLVLLVAVEGFSSVVHPAPPEAMESMEAMCAHVERYPAWVLAVCVPMWAATGFLGTWISGKLGGLASALVIGLLVVLGLISNLAMLPYPIWFKIACLLAVPAAVAAAIYLTSRRRTPAPIAAV